MFHSEWERAVFTSVLALLGAGHFSVDEFRRATEQIPPAQYLSLSYYEKWLAALLTLMHEKDVISPDELAAGKSLRSNGSVLPPLDKDKARYILGNPHWKAWISTTPARPLIARAIRTRCCESSAGFGVSIRWEWRMSSSRPTAA